MLGEHLEDAARHLEVSLGRLIRIGGGADDDRLAFDEREMLVAAEAEGAREDVGGVALDEDVALEGEPGRNALDLGGGAVDEAVGGGCALHDVAMCVARVAVCAAEGASDVGIDRPVGHPCGAGVVEDGARVGGVVGDVALGADDGELAERALDGFGEEGEGVGGGERRGHWIGSNGGGKMAGTENTEEMPKKQDGSIAGMRDMRHSISIGATSYWPR